MEFNDQDNSMHTRPFTKVIRAASRVDAIACALGCIAQERLGQQRPRMLASAVEAVCVCARAHAPSRDRGKLGGNWGKLGETGGN